MASRAIGPKLIVGIAIGIPLGFLAIANIYAAGALVLLALYLLGKFSTRTDPSGFRVMSAEQAKAEIADMLTGQAEQARLAVWRAGRDATPTGCLPGSPINLDRPFTAYTDCEHGHQDFHPIGETSHDGTTKWINRSCALDGCDSVWREKA